MTTRPAVAFEAPPPQDAPQEAIGGRCMTETGEEMPCVFEDVGIAEMRVTGTEPLKKGTVLICYLNEVGILPARIMGESPHGGWLIRPFIPDERKERVASRLAWHRQRFQERAEQRAAIRIVPVHRRVIVQLGERLSFRGTIQNLSTTGAAIALNQACVPYVGSPVRTGKREATVVRLTADGIAVHFKVAIPAASFHERMIL